MKVTFELAEGRASKMPPAATTPTMIAMTDRMMFLLLFSINRALFVRPDTGLDVEGRDPRASAPG
jgi:hypothetical protein